MPIADPWFYVVAVPALLVTGISKSGLGGGLGIVAVPLMALVISPIQAAAIMLPILCAMDVFGLWAFRNIWHRRNLAIMLPAAVVGIAVGALSFRYLNEDMVRLLLGLIAIGFTLNHWFGRRPADYRALPSVPVGGALSALSGFTSFIAHAGGPPVQFYLLPQRLDKTLFIGTTVVYFFVVNYIKLIPYWWLGQFSAENLTTALALGPLAPIGIWVGFRLHQAIPGEAFYRICYGLLLVTGLKLVWDSLEGFL